MVSNLLPQTCLQQILNILKPFHKKFLLVYFDVFANLFLYQNAQIYLLKIKHMLKV